jgi:hypothetical protein
MLTRLKVLLVACMALAVTAVHAEKADGWLDIFFDDEPATGSSAPQKARLYTASKALVIGQDTYRDRAWPRLSMGIADARAVAAALEAQGFAVTLKTDLESVELERAFRDFFITDGSDPEARLLVWFAGHGHTIANEGYLVPVDAPNPERADTEFRTKAISLRRFGEYMREARAKHVLAIFDSCFAGTVFNVARSPPPRAITLSTSLPVRQFISAGDANQTVSDNGTFRRLFVDAIEGREPMADANGDGYITGSELGIFLFDKVTNLSGEGQTPRFGKLNALGLDRGDFVLQRRAGTSVAAPPVPQTKDALLAAPPPAAPDRARTVDDCDVMAAAPYDQQGTAPPVALDAILTSRALPACEQAVREQPTSLRFQFQLARVHDAKGQFEQAKAGYETAAAGGYAAAMNALASWYNAGRGVPMDRKEGVFWLRKGIAAGNVDSMMWLAHAYQSDGHFGIWPADQSEAARLYQRAVDGGHTAAMVRLSLMHDHGHGGLTPDPRLAVALLLRALKAGEPEAVTHMFTFGGSHFTPAFRRELQAALKTEGVYDAALDGDFGMHGSPTYRALEKVKGARP